LLVKNMFLPYPTPSAAASNELAATVSSAYARGYRVKVAVIATETDLGSVPSLFNRPGDHARFLGQELKGHQGSLRQRARSVGHARRDDAPELSRVRRQRQDARANGGS
jgi:hypothetical protein